MAEDQKAALKKIAEQLKIAADRAKKLKTDADNADKQVDAVEAENK